MKLTISSLGTGAGTKTDEFSEKFQRGGKGGVIFNPNIYIADFGHIYGALKRIFRGL